MGPPPPVLPPPYLHGPSPLPALLLRLLVWRLWRWLLGVAGVRMALLGGVLGAAWSVVWWFVMVLMVLVVLVVLWA